MMALPLAEVGFLMGLLGVVWVFIALSLILIVLVQKGKGGGLSAAFGGGAGAGGLLGTKTGDFLTWVTISLVAGFFITSIFMVKYFKPLDPTGLNEDLAPVVTPVDPPAAEAAAAGVVEKVEETTEDAEAAALKKLEELKKEAEAEKTE